MATSNVTNNYKYSGRGPLDAKLEPVETVADLKKITGSHRFEGMTVYVTSEKKEYWYIKNETGKSSWVPKTANGGEITLVGSDVVPD